VAKADLDCFDDQHYDGEHEVAVEGVHAGGARAYHSGRSSSSIAGIVQSSRATASLAALSGPRLPTRV
jgi:hypothetical protein